MVIQSIGVILHQEVYRLSGQDTVQQKKFSLILSDTVCSSDSVSISEMSSALDLTATDYHIGLIILQCYTLQDVSYQTASQ